MTESATNAVQRKLTTLFCADVKGYSELMGRDEEGTLARLKAYRQAMIGLISRHHGRTINTWGDGLLAEFASPVEAVTCAAEVQRELRSRNEAETGQPAMLFRIGINLGDVMVDGDDLYGEGVNVAARLEAQAEPGGIAISRTVYDQVRNKLGLGFEFVGEREVKNIADKVEVYRVVLDAEGRAQAQPHDQKPYRPAALPPRPAEAAAAPEVMDRLAWQRRIWMRRAWQGGTLIVFLLAINLITNPNRLWVVWPALGIALTLAWSWLHRVGFPGREAQEPVGAIRINGNHRFTEDCCFSGRIKGNVSVDPGITVQFFGRIDGNIELSPGAVFEMHGRLGGTVIDNGGSFRPISG